MQERHSRDKSWSPTGQKGVWLGAVLLQLQSRATTHCMKVMAQQRTCLTWGSREDCCKVEGTGTPVVRMQVALEGHTSSKLPEVGSRREHGAASCQGRGTPHARGTQHTAEGKAAGQTARCWQRGRTSSAKP